MACFADIRCRLFLRMSTGWAKKAEPQTHDHNSVKSYRWKKITVRFFGKFVVKWILKIPPHLAYVATLLRETLMSAKQAISNKFHSFATYLRCGGDVNNQIMKGLLLSLSANFLKSVNIWQSYKQERDCLVHIFRLLAVCWPGAQNAWDNHHVTLPIIHRF